MQINNSTPPSSTSFGAKLIIKSKPSAIHNLLIHMASDLKKQSIGINSVIENGPRQDGLCRVLVTSENEEQVLSGLERALTPSVYFGADLYKPISKIYTKTVNKFINSAEEQFIKRPEELRNLPIFKNVNLDIPNA